MGVSALNSYGAAGANATVYNSQLTDKAVLKQALAGAVSSVKSCSFELATGTSLDRSALSAATLTIQGQAQAQSTSNGWSMADDTRLQLNGGACTLWREPESQTIRFDVPCGSVTAN